MLQEPASSVENKSGFRKALFRAILLGLPGVLSLLLVLPSFPGVPRAALLINAFALLVIASAIGAACAPRAGLKSHLLLGDAVRTGDLILLMQAAGAGVVLGLATALLDQFLARGWQADSTVPSLANGWSGTQLLVGMLYGGITEEIGMRWGLLSGLMWIALKLLGGQPSGRRTAAGLALIFSAAAFAAGHLPALLAAGNPTAILFIRTLGLNFVAGIAFGLAFLRRRLEAAIVLHAGFHVGVAIASVSVG